MTRLGEGAVPIVVIGPVVAPRRLTCSIPARSTKGSSMAGTCPEAGRPEAAGAAPRDGVLWPRPVPMIGDPSSAAEPGRRRPTRGRPCATTVASLRAGRRRAPRHPPVPTRPRARRRADRGARGRPPRVRRSGTASPGASSSSPRPATRDAGGADGRPGAAAPGRRADAGRRRAACSTCSWRASARRPSASSSRCDRRTAGRRGARPRHLPRRRPLVAAPARSRTCGWPPAPRASASAG